MTYSTASLRRAGFVGGGKLLTFVTQAPPTVALEAYAHSIQNLNDLMVLRETSEHFVTVNGPMLTPQGPMALVAECEPASALPEMLEVLATHLEEQGLDGSLTVGRTYRDAFFDDHFRYCAGMYATLPVTPEWIEAHKRPENRTGKPLVVPAWGVDDSEFGAVERLVDWVVTDPGELAVSVGIATVRIERDGLTGFLREVLPVDRMVSVTQTERASHRRRRIGFWDYGTITAQTYDEARPFNDHVDELTELMVTLAPHLTTSVVTACCLGDEQLEALVSVSPWRGQALRDVMAQGQGWKFKSLEADHVYDVGVTQMLNPAQHALADPSAGRWEVLPVGGDKSLIRHREPDRWSLTGGFDPRPGPTSRGAGQAVLVEAREDFAAALIPATVE